MDDKIINGIYDAALEPQRWDGLLQDLSQQFDGAAVYVGQTKLKQCGLGDIWTLGFENGGWNAVPEAEQASHAGKGPATIRDWPVLVPFDRRQIFSDEEVERDPAASAFLTANGLLHAAFCKVQADTEFVSVFFVARDRTQPLEGDEFHRFAALMPHLGQAMRTHRALRRAHGVAQSFQAALDRLERGVALIDGELRIVHANPAMESIFEHRRGMARHFGRFRLTAQGAQRVLEGAARRLIDPRGGYRGTTVEAPGPDGQLSYTLTLAPALGDATTGLAPAARILILVTDERRTVLEAPTGWLERAFDLTPAEARIAALAARAMRPAEIAEALGVSENTVKSQLKSVYAKLGVRSLAELVRTVLTRLC